MEDAIARAVREALSTTCEGRPYPVALSYRLTALLRTALAKFPPLPACEHAPAGQINCETCRVVATRINAIANALGTRGLRCDSITLTSMLTIVAARMAAHEMPRSEFLEMCGDVFDSMNVPRRAIGAMPS